MIFIIIIILTLIASYLIVTTGVLWNKKIYNVDNTIPSENLFPSHIQPGMYGSPPSDAIDAYDSRKPLNMPIVTNIGVLLDSFADNAKNVYDDFTKNINSVYYKLYLTDDYKLFFLDRSQVLSSQQTNDYYKIYNTLGKDIENRISYFLDSIKFSTDKSYFLLRKSIVSDDGTRLSFGNPEIERITDYVMQETDIPNKIVILLKYKLDQDTQSLLDELIMVAGYNYYKTLELLSIVLKDEEPNENYVPLLGIDNTPKVVGGVTIKGFWSQIYLSFIANNINANLIELLKTSFLNEKIYKGLLANIMSNTRNVMIANALNSLVHQCKRSKFTLLNTMPYRFTFIMVTHAIRENLESIAIHGQINVEWLDREVSAGASIQNIDKYRNFNVNFPIAYQRINQSDDNAAVVSDMKLYDYPIFTKDSVVNGFISFPDVSISGVYFDRIQIQSYNTGFVLISNISTSNATIEGLAIYGAIVNQTNNNNIPIRDAFLDSNIIFVDRFVTLKAGVFDFNSNTLTRTDEMGSINDMWVSGKSITLKPGFSIQIVIDTPMTLQVHSYVRLYGIMIPTNNNRPVNDFLRINVFNDGYNTIVGNSKSKQYTFINIPESLNNMVFSFNFPKYQVTNAPTAMVESYSTIQTIEGFNPTGTFLYPIYNLSTAAVSNGRYVLANPGIFRNSLYTALSTKNTDNVAALDTIFGNLKEGLVNNTQDLINASGLVNNMANRNIYQIFITNTSTQNRVNINKIVVFGVLNNSSISSQRKALTLFSDRYVIPATVMRVHPTVFSGIADLNTQLNNFNSGSLASFPIPTVNFADTSVINVLSDINNRQLTTYSIPATEGICIQPRLTPSPGTGLVDNQVTNKFINVLGTYIEFGDVNRNNFSSPVNIGVKVVSNVSNKLFNYNYSISLGSTISSFDKVGMVLLLGSENSATAGFMVSPEHFRTIPTYTYDEFYDPISELSQTNNHWY